MGANTLLEETGASRDRFFQDHRPLFARLAVGGQTPQVIFIGCSDSRVIPEAIMGAKPGDIFVLRSLANVIPPYGTGERAVGAAIEYALRHLSVRCIVVCGHTDCGGIKALDTHLDHLDEPHLARWIEYARPAQTQIDARGVAPDARHRRIVEQNVLLQLENLRSYDAVREALRSGELELYGWVYDLASGRINEWDADTEQFVDEDKLFLAVSKRDVL